MNVTTPKGGKFYGEELQELTSNGKGGEKNRYSRVTSPVSITIHHIDKYFCNWNSSIRVLVIFVYVLVSYFFFGIYFQPMLAYQYFVVYI